VNNLSIIKAIILGAIQGASEFLPVSSSGHLVIAQELLGVRLEGSGLLAFDVCLHFGTLIAIVAVFWRDIVEIIRAFVKPCETSEVSQARRLGLMIVLGTVPAVIAALLFADFFESLVSNPMAAAAMLLVTGAILWMTRFSREMGEGASGLKWWRSIVIGCAQAAAIIPGISRSGSTISAGLFLGLDRTLAARFSFLLAVPAIAGAMVLNVDDLAALSSDILLAVIIGTIVSAIVGFACIKWLLSLIRRGHFSVFAYYCWTIGIAAIVYKVFVH